METLVGILVCVTLVLPFAVLIWAVAYDTVKDVWRSHHR